MSGGTLIALAADEIVMSEYAVLGPVDPQLGEYPAASILKAVAKKPVAETEDKTLRRFLKKNVLIQDVGVGLITMSYLGKCGSRFNRASTACIAALPSETPFWYIL